MTDSGTIQEKDTLSTPKTGEEYSDMLNKAVSEGNTEEVNRLMTLEWTPDPDAEAKVTEVIEAAAPTEEEKEAAKKAEEDKAKEAVKETPGSQPTEVAPVATESVPVQVQKVETPEEKLVKLEAELQRLRSDAGRVGHLQSRLAQLEKATKLKESVKAAVKAPEVETELDKKIKERIKNLREVDPDTAELLEAMREEARVRAEERVTAATESLTDTITQQDEEARLRAELDKVLQVHPEFDSIRRHVYWHRWKDSLPPEARAWAESDRADQVIEAVRAFKEQMAAYQQPAPVQQPSVQQQPVETQTPPVETVDDATKKAREQRLAATTSSKDTPIKDGNVFDREAMFSEMYAKIQKDNGIK